jgi:hypothetical protein
MKSRNLFAALLFAACALPASADTFSGSYNQTGNWSDPSKWPAVGGIPSSFNYPGATPTPPYSYPGWDMNIADTGHVTLDVSLGSTSPVRLDIQFGGSLTNAYAGSTSFYQPSEGANQAIKNWGTINVPVGNLGMFTHSGDSSLINYAGGVIDLTGTGGLTFNNFIENDGTLTLADSSNTIAGQYSSLWHTPNFHNVGTLQGGGSLGTGSGDVWVTNDTNGTIDANASDPLVIVSENSYGCLACGIQNYGLVEVELGSTLHIYNGVYTQHSGNTKVLGTLTSNQELDITGGTIGGPGTINANIVLSGTGLFVVGDPQTSTINGTFTLQSGAGIYMDVFGPNPGDADHIIFNEAANLSAGTIFLDIPLNVNLNGLSLSLFSFNGGQVVGGLPTFSFVNGQNYQVQELQIGEGNTVFQFSGNTFTGDTTPEPATFGLFAGALALLALWGRRYRLPTSNLR